MPRQMAKTFSSAPLVPMYVGFTKELSLAAAPNFGIWATMRHNVANNECCQCRKSQFALLEEALWVVVLAVVVYICLKLLLDGVLGGNDLGPRYLELLDARLGRRLGRLKLLV